MAIVICAASGTMLELSLEVISKEWAASSNYCSPESVEHSVYER